MRTTIEMKPEHRARLLELAARRGEKGFSNLVAEAIQTYLERDGERDGKRRQALRLRGALSAGDAERLRRHVAGVRENWR